MCSPRSKNEDGGGVQYLLLMPIPEETNNVSFSPSPELRRCCDADNAYCSLSTSPLRYVLNQYFMLDS